MRLATIANEERDGELVVVNRDNTRCAPVTTIAPTLQRALDRWVQLRPALEAAARALDLGEGPSWPFDVTRALAPLPRAYQWIDASGYLSHILRVRKARGAPMPPHMNEEPLIYQGLSDPNHAWNAPLFTKNGWGADFEAEIAVVVDDVPQGIAKEKASSHIALALLVNDVSLRKLVAPELAKGFGFFVSKPASAYAPIAVSLDEFGDAWNGATLQLEVEVRMNGELIGRLRTGGAEQHFSFADIIEYAARTRPLGAGTIIGAGTVSNADASRGAACLAEWRVMEQGSAALKADRWLDVGDTVRINAIDSIGASPFGAIDQTVTLAPGA